MTTFDHTKSSGKVGLTIHKIWGKLVPPSREGGHWPVVILNAKAGNIWWGTSLWDRHVVAEVPNVRLASCAQSPYIGEVCPMELNTSRGVGNVCYFLVHKHISLRIIRSWLGMRVHVFRWWLVWIFFPHKIRMHLFPTFIWKRANGWARGSLA